MAAYGLSFQETSIFNNKKKKPFNFGLLHKSPKAEIRIGLRNDAETFIPVLYKEETWWWTL